MVAAATHHSSRHGRSYTGSHLHHQATGKIKRPQPVWAEKTTGAPHHVGQRQIDEGAPEQHKQHPGTEIHPLHHRSGDQCRRDDREGELEEGHRTVAELTIAIGRRPVAQPGPLKAADEGCQRPASRRKGEAVAEQNPEHADQPHGRKAHHHGVEHIAAAHKAGIEEGQRRRHHQHQRCTDQHEAVVRRVLRRIGSQKKQSRLSSWGEPPAQPASYLVAKATDSGLLRVVRNIFRTLHRMIGHKKRVPQDPLA